MARPLRRGMAVVRPRRDRRVVRRRRGYRYHPYAPVAVDGDTVVATGRSTYRETPQGPVTEIFDNCFVIRFDAAGRCREFTEYYIKQPKTV